jgi:hypothetical protein
MRAQFQVRKSTEGQQRNDLRSGSLPSNPRCRMKQPIMFATDFRCPMLDNRSLEFLAPAQHS